MVDWRLYIQSNPGVLYGNPTLKHTRIPVNLILEKLALGDSVENLLDAYQNIEREAINACLLFAADSVKNEIVLDLFKFLKGINSTKNIY